MFARLAGVREERDQDQSKEDGGRGAVPTESAELETDSRKTLMSRTSVPDFTEKTVDIILRLASATDEMDGRGKAAP